ncbi:MAG TPA: amino acid ABC transporter permease [Alphaproteobacteria bacterium]|nr:amino acid ABC transporter permease [Alphaproteobacteria bacterium]HAJ46970.1 amino acid ABC transporter permease [Alphaproteobacteria bacterium]
MLRVLAMFSARRRLDLVAQALAVGFAAWLLYVLFMWAFGPGAAERFRFLRDETGYDIIQHLVPYTEQSTHARALLVGVLNTLLVAVLGIILATILGFTIGIGSVSGNWLVAKLCEAYVETVRNVPVLLQLFFWYFAALRAVPGPRESWSLFDSIFLNNRGLYVPSLTPQDGAGLVGLAALAAIALWIALSRWAHDRRMATGQGFPAFWVGAGLFLGLPALAALATGLPFTPSFPSLQGFNFEGGLVILPELIALVLALSVYAAAYIAETVRAGIEGVQRGQVEAAQAIGLTRAQTLRLVVVPQALRIIIPPLTSQYMNLTKNSSLATAIAYPDLVSVFAGTSLNQTGREIEIIVITMAIYLTLSLLTSLVMNWYNARIALTGAR